MNLRNNIMPKSLLKSCQDLLPEITFIEGKTFFWSPGSRAIHIDTAHLEDQTGKWALLHEVAHAQLNHASYANDAALLKLEVDAWEMAQITAKTLDMQINSDHIQDCLNTYRDWLYARSTCPTCALNSLQTESTTYICLNCSTRWSVSQSRFCRPYRMQSKHKKTPSESSQTVFV